MSRSGYLDGEDGDLDNWRYIRWRGAVNSAAKGKRGQAFFSELLDAMDAMHTKRLIANALEADGEFCALGVLGHKRGIDMAGFNPEDSESIANKFDIAAALAKEIVFMNDEDAYHNETPEHRWSRMRSWVAEQITRGEG